MTVNWNFQDCTFSEGVPVHHYYGRDDQRISVDGSWKCKSSHTFHMTSEINFASPAFGRVHYEHEDYVFKSKKSGSWSITHQCNFNYPNAGASVKTWQTVWLREAGSPRWETPYVKLYCGIWT